MLQTDVVVVGAGPVGLGLAIDLGQRGINVVVLERTVALHNIPKGQNLTQRTAEHFQTWGVYDDMQAARRVPASYGSKGVTAYGTFLGEYRYDWLKRADVAEYYAAPNMRLPQYDAEEVLRARAAELPSVTVLYGHKVTNVEDRGDAVCVTSQRQDGTEVSVTGAYAVGCDGSRSLVREAAGITQTRRSHDKKMVLLVLKSTALHDMLEQHPGYSYYNALHPDFEGYWQFLGRVDLGETFFFHAPVDPATTAETLDPAACLYRATGAEFPFTIDYQGFWELRIEIADSYQSGRLFIAGDAAHSHPPYGGYGVNTGFEDARNLSWKLAATLQGWAGPGLLDSYTVERQPVFAATAEKFIERMIYSDRDFLAAFDPEKDRAAFEAEWGRRAELTKMDVTNFVPNYMGSPIVAEGPGSPSAWGDHMHEAKPGMHLTPEDDVFARLGNGFTLVQVGDDALDVNRFRQVADQSGVPLDIVRMAETAETRRWQARQILVRPDHFIAWVDTGQGDDPAEVFARATGGASD